MEARWFEDEVNDVGGFTVMATTSNKRAGGDEGEPENLAFLSNAVRHRKPQTLYRRLFYASFRQLDPLVASCRCGLSQSLHASLCNVHTP